MRVKYPFALSSRLSKLPELNSCEYTRAVQPVITASHGRRAHAFDGAIEQQNMLFQSCNHGHWRTKFPVVFVAVERNWMKGAASGTVPCAERQVLDFFGLRGNCLYAVL